MSAGLDREKYRAILTIPGAAGGRHVGVGNLPADRIVQLLQLLQLYLELSDGRLRDLQILHVPLIFFLYLNFVSLVYITKLVPVRLVLLGNFLVLLFYLTSYFFPLVSDLFFKIVFCKKITEFFQNITNIGPLVIGLLSISTFLLLPRADDIPPFRIFYGRVFENEVSS